MDPDAGFSFDPSHVLDIAEPTCPVCELPIIDDDRHTRDDGADVHGACCPDCR